MHLKIALALIRSEKKFQLFRVFIGSPAAPWHTDSKNIYMSIANIIASGSKMRKSFGKLQFLKIAISQRFFAVFAHLEKYLLWTYIYFWNQCAKAQLLSQ